MSIWAVLKEAIETDGTATSILDKLASDNVASRVRGELSRLNGQHLPDEAVALLGRIFALAATELRAGLAHDFLGELILLAGELGCAGIYVAEALDCLQSVLERQPRTKHETAQASHAVDSLLRCLSSENPILTEAALIAFGIAIARIPQPDRKRLLDAAAKLPSTAVPSRHLVPSLGRYHDRLTRLEKAIEASTFTAKDALSVITIHSHKGGVGKTTVAIALALELASRKRRVCVVDCDDEGPSLHYYLPVDAARQKDVLFFSDWFCTDQRSLPQGLVQHVHQVDLVSFVAGSFLGVDITWLDEHIGQLRQRSTAGSLVEGRIVQLIQLLLEKDFDSVVLDTSPGLTRLSLDVLAASFRVAGSRVFVMRPRPVDIAQLCVEEDWIVRLPNQAGSAAVVVNFSRQEGESKTIDLRNAQSLANALTKWPQFDAYSNRFSATNISEMVQHMVLTTWPQFRVVELHEVKTLAHAVNIQGPSLVSAILANDATLATTKEILDQLQAGYTPLRSEA